MATLKYKNQTGEYVTLPNYTVNMITPVQTTGESTTDVMSQKAVTDAINNIKVEGTGYTYDPETDSIILGLYDSNKGSAWNYIIEKTTYDGEECYKGPVSIITYNTIYNDSEYTEYLGDILGLKVLFSDPNDFPSEVIFLIKKGEENLNIPVDKVYYFKRESLNLISKNSVISGIDNSVSGVACTAQGNANTVHGAFSHVEGFYSYAVGGGSHVEGYACIANLSGHAEGLNTFAFGLYSHAEGGGTQTVGEASHAEGVMTYTTNTAEHAQGIMNKSNPNTIHSIGVGNRELNVRKNAIEIMNNGDVFVIGAGNYDGTNPTEAIRLLDLLVNNGESSGESNGESNGTGDGSVNTGESNKGEGYTYDKETGSFIIGDPVDMDSSGRSFVATGISEEEIQSDPSLLNFKYCADFDEPFIVMSLIYDNENYQGDYKIIKSYITNPGTNKLYFNTTEDLIIGNTYYYKLEFGIKESQYSVATALSRNIGGYSFSEGSYTFAAGMGAHAEGYLTTATGEMCSHAEGLFSNASGPCSHAEGMMSIALGGGSHTEGYLTLAFNVGEHALGLANKSNSNEDKTIYTIDSIGIGNNDTLVRRNGTEVMNNGDVYIIGIGGYDGTNPFESKTVQQVLNEILEKLG